MFILVDGGVIQPRANVSFLEVLIEAARRYKWMEAALIFSDS